MLTVSFIIRLCEGRDKMLTEQEILNNALKEMKFREEMTSKKYQSIKSQVTDPKLQELLGGLEIASRNNHGTITQKAESLKIG